MPRRSLPEWPSEPAPRIADRARTAPLWRASRAVLWLAAACLAFAGAVRSARAQGAAFRTTGEGLNVGRFIVYPSLGLEFLYDSNVRYASEDLFAEQNLGSGEFHLMPRIMVDMPIGESHVRWVYAPVYRTYKNDALGLQPQLSHYFDLDASLHIGPALRVAIREHYVRGTEEVGEVDPGGELKFGLTPFVMNAPSMVVDLDLGARHGVSLLPRYTRVTFDETLSAPLFGYTTRMMEGRYNYRLTLTDMLYGYYTSEGTDQRRGSLLFSDLVLDGQGVGVGLSRTVNQEMTTSASAGYKRWTFGGGAASDFSGLVADINSTLRLSDASSMVLILSRLPYQSFFLDQGYYLDHHLEAKYLRQVGENLYWEIGGSIGSNTYEDKVNLSVRPETPATEDCDGDGVLDGSDCDGDGQIDSLETIFCVTQASGAVECPSVGARRRDQVGRFQIGIGYRPQRTVTVFIGYNSELRRSNIEQAFNGEFFDPFQYDINRLFFRIDVGWQ